MTRSNQADGPARPLTAGALWLGVAQPEGTRGDKSWPAATFAIAIKDGKVVGAAPIATWAIGRSEPQVVAFYKSRGSLIKELPGG